MRIPYTKFVHPIGQKEFVLHIVKCLSVQFVLSLIVIILLNFKLIDTEWLFGEWDNFYAAWIVNLLFLCFVYDLNKFRARFKDIYPDLELNKIFYFLAGFVPVFFFAMITFLCVKKGESGKTYPRAFKFRYAIPALVVLMIMQGSFSKFNFLTASPSSYYQIELLRGSMTATHYKMKPGTKDIFTDYQKEVPGELNTSEIVILLSKISANHRAIASETEGYKNAYDLSFKFLPNCHRAIELSEDNDLKFSDFSPIHWLHPSGPVEILMTKTFSQSMTDKSSRQLLWRCMSLVEKLEDQVEDNKYPEAAEYRKELAEMRMKFYRTKAFSKDALWAYERK